MREFGEVNAFKSKKLVIESHHLRHPFLFPFYTSLLGWADVRLFGHIRADLEVLAMNFVSSRCCCCDIFGCCTKVSLNEEAIV